MRHFSNCTCTVHSKMPIHKTSSFITKSRVVYLVFDMKSKKIAKLWNAATNLRKWVRPNNIVNQANQSTAASLNKDDIFPRILNNKSTTKRICAAVYYIILQYFPLLVKILGNFCYLRWDFTTWKMEEKKQQLVYLPPWRGTRAAEATAHWRFRWILWWWKLRFLLSIFQKETSGNPLKGKGTKGSRIRQQSRQSFSVSFMQALFNVLNYNSIKIMMVLWHMLHCYQSRQTLYRHLCTLYFTTLLQILRTALYMQFFSPNIAYYPVILRRCHCYSPCSHKIWFTEQCCVGTTGKKCRKI